MSSTALTFQSAAEHRAWLATQARLPRGFRAGTATLEFAPVEVPTKRGRMTLTLVALDRPSTAFAAAFTRNAFPGAPVLVGRRRAAGRRQPGGHRQGGGDGRARPRHHAGVPTHRRRPVTRGAARRARRGQP